MVRCLAHKKVARLTQKLCLAALVFGVFARVTATPLVAAESFHKTRDLFTLHDLATLPSLALAQSPSMLGKGKFLVASRELSDPNFAESVILLLDYNQNGALGVIINRPTEVPLTNLLPEVKALRKRKDVAYLGGPVARHMLMILTRSANPPHDSQQVFSDIYLVSHQGELEQMLRLSKAQTKLRAYVGYAGWVAGQLDTEVVRGGWHIVPADAALVFDKAATDVWPELIRRGEALWARNRRSLEVPPQWGSLLTFGSLPHDGVVFP